MCGIAAILNPGPDDALPDRIRRMLAILRHRGPDDDSIAVFQDGRMIHGGKPGDAAFGLARLAIQDLSESGRQPMVDPSGRYWIVFNGEIYNFIELREDLERCGETFRGRSDTEVLLRLLALRGLECLERLDGMFAFLLFDCRDRRVLMARDQYGIKPLYYRIGSDGTIWIASEIKPLALATDWSPTANGQRVYDFLNRGVIDHTDETLFEGVRQVPPGSVMEVSLRNGKPALSAARSWASAAPARPEATPAAWPSQLGRLLETSVDHRLRADVVVGSCLSGGLDSSSIVSIVGDLIRARGDQHRFKTVTARHPDARWDEWPFAQAVAEWAGVDAVPVRPTADDMFANLERLVRIQDEPFASPSIFFQFKVFEAAAQHGVTCMLDGQGADELLGGYHTFFRVQLHEHLRHARLKTFFRSVRRIHRQHGHSLTSLFGGALAVAFPAGLLRMMRKSAVTRVIDHRSLGASPDDPFHRLPGRRMGMRAFTLDLLRAVSLPMLLHWEDRNSMAHGVEARLPFLAPKLASFAISLPGEAKIDGAVTKSVLRRAMEGRLPPTVINRLEKVAFVAPEEKWLCESHRGTTRGLLGEACGETLRDVITPEGGRRLLRIVRQEQPYDNLLWRVICLSSWMKAFSVRL